MCKDVAFLRPPQENMRVLIRRVRHGCKLMDGFKQLNFRERNNYIKTYFKALILAKDLQIVAKMLETATTRFLQKAGDTFRIIGCKFYPVN